MSDDDDPPFETDVPLSGPGLGLDEPPQPAAPPAVTTAVAATPSAAPQKSDSKAYRVLARKYRPANFDELIGQEALVRTLTNAIEAGRIAQAFMLTGVRGVGKTTTARIVAKALNCIGPDGTGGPTVNPCGVCQHCVGIAEDRHVDVIEMDAASRTGVDDIRELIDGVRYRPVSARYKVYVLDEVHMLSKNAFNALLKTLEEPPEHVKFVFATTEIRKVPVTVLSRCQRFDLRRVPVDQLAAHFKKVSELEGVTIDPDALGMVARAADGSVRDGLSILDQAIALSAGTVSTEQVRDMLGLADRGRMYDLFDATIQGDAKLALTLLEELYGVGADPVVVIEDLLDITHFLTRVILVPEALDRPTTAELERTRGKDMAQRLSLPVLARAWQMLLKGLGEVRAAPSAIQAAEMVLIRLIHVADMPTPGDLVAKLKDFQPGAGGSGGGSHGGGSGGGGVSASLQPTVIRGGRGTAAMAQEQSMPNAAISAQQANNTLPKTFLDVVALFEEKRKGILASNLKRDVHLVHFEPGRLEFRPGRNAPADLHGQIGKLLSDWTGTRWVVSVSNQEGSTTIAEQEAQADLDRRGRAEKDPLVQAVKKAFPGAQITRVTAADSDLSDGLDAQVMDMDSPDLALDDPDASEFFDPEDDL
ncbi:MAG: DNA polymerase III subunit gamma/tau [Alphaproteobacteria bacterium]|nr:DNA polymerase III subunit gamma/tau [Alphaproteobacteria bacterium]